MMHVKPWHCLIPGPFSVLAVSSSNSNSNNSYIEEDAQCILNWLFTINPWNSCRVNSTLSFSSDYWFAQSKIFSHPAHSRLVRVFEHFSFNGSQLALSLKLDLICWKRVGFKHTHTYTHTHRHMKQQQPKTEFRAERIQGWQPL